MVIVHKWAAWQVYQSEAEREERSTGEESKNVP